MTFFKKIFSIFYKFIIANLLVMGAIFGNKLEVKEKPQEKNIESEK